MKLNGLKIDFLGDSITEGIGVADVKNNRYDNIIKHKCGLEAVYNYGISGTRIAHQSRASEFARSDLCFCGRAYDMNVEADIVVVFGGTNDYDHGDAMFGDITDKTQDTFCGAVDFLMRFLLEIYKKSKIVFITPARREGDLFPSSDTVKKDARVLKEYVDVIVEKGKQYNIPVLNLYEKLGIDPNKSEDKEKYTIDGLHFNDLGHEVIADCLIEFLNNL